ncbi:MAG: cadmium-translocating P-type ATPase [gamma proteobacterium symbiont of Bathyaustriella thionipta]|nr:cadmium-translocating P-type ATPase [gamma proteobacterium symbiont of Bathyaustriella thionipta]
MGESQQQPADKNCFHCGLPVPHGVDYCVDINGQSQPMCCLGCQAVARAIIDNGLTDFYKHRTSTSGKAEQLIPDALQQMDLYDQEALQKSFVRSDGEHVREASLILEGIVCAACVWLNERHVQALPGVITFQINYSTHRARLKWDNEQIHLSDVLKAIAAIGYLAHPFDPGRQEAVYRKERSAALKRLAVAGLGAMQIMMLAVPMYAAEKLGMDTSMENFLRWVSLLLASIVVLYSAQSFFQAAWRDIKRKQPGMDVPVALAVSIAFIASAINTVTGEGTVYFDSASMFVFFLLASRFLEMGARHRAGQVAEALIKLLPDTALRLQAGQSQRVAVNELCVGDIVLIKPGEPVPADGVVVDGQSSVDESLLSGESLPVARTLHDELTGGSINVESPLQMRVEKIGQDTRVSAIVRLLERAQSEKPRLAQLADRVARWFVSLLLLLATSVALLWWWIDPTQVLPITLAVLVVTCPCALSLATPVALTVASGRLTRHGLLTTRGHALETLAKVTQIVFDKTGTLTQGKLSVGKIHNFSSHSEAEIRQLLATLEQGSEHPLAQVLAELAQPRAVEALRSEPGGGVEGRIDGKKYRAGKLDFVLEAGMQAPAISGHATLVALADEKQLLACVELHDAMRADAASAVAGLQQMGIKVSLLSGDASGPVRHLAEKLDIADWQAAATPQDKLQRIQQLQQQGEVVAMVGDGVNDAPVLSAANVSIAMGGGTQLAQSSADMVILSESLNSLLAGRNLAIHTLAVIRQNFAWAIAYNVVLVPLAAIGLIAPWMAAIGMSLSSLVVVFNSLRLRRVNMEKAS